MAGIIGRKVGMTRIFDEAGNQIPVTVIEAGPCPVTHVRTREADGYAAVQLGFGAKKASRAPKAEVGHVAKMPYAPDGDEGKASYVARVGKTWRGWLFFERLNGQLRYQHDPIESLRETGVAPAPVAVLYRTPAAADRKCSLP